MTDGWIVSRRRVVAHLQRGSSVASSSADEDWLSSMMPAQCTVGLKLISVSEQWALQASVVMRSVPVGSEVTTETRREGSAIASCGGLDDLNDILPATILSSLSSVFSMGGFLSMGYVVPGKPSVSRDFHMSSGFAGLHGPCVRSSMMSSILATAPDSTFPVSDIPGLSSDPGVSSDPVMTPLPHPLCQTFQWCPQIQWWHHFHIPCVRHSRGVLGSSDGTTPTFQGCHQIQWWYYFHNPCVRRSRGVFRSSDGTTSTTPVLDVPGVSIFNQSAFGIFRSKINIWGRCVCVCGMHKCQRPG